MIPPGGGEFLFYQSDDGRIRLQVRLEDESVWLTQAQLSELFQRERSVITKHIRNIFEEGELEEPAACANFARTAADGKTYQTVYYNLDVIISVVYRVKSQRGTQFRIWATQRLRESIVKGFTMDDERLKQRGGGNYFEELLARIRDIRSSEKEFWRKVLEIYATSIDYDPSVEASRQFFATVQNKMHWAAHGQTSAEVIHARVDGTKPQVGMTNWVGAKPSKAEAVIAKNYLTPEELNALNRIVVAYRNWPRCRRSTVSPCICATGWPGWMISCASVVGTSFSTPGRFPTSKQCRKRSWSSKNSTVHNLPCHRRWSRTLTQR